MKKLILLALIIVGMTISCAKEPKQSDWKVEISSTGTISDVTVKSIDYAFEDHSITTTSFTHEFVSRKDGVVGVKAWGSGTLTIKVWKDGKDMKEISGAGVGSGLIFEY